jgi:hypothetical protein
MHSPRARTHTRSSASKKAPLAARRGGWRRRVVAEVAAHRIEQCCVARQRRAPAAVCAAVGFFRRNAPLCLVAAGDDARRGRREGRANQVSRHRGSSPALPAGSVGDRRVGTAARCRRQHATWHRRLGKALPPRSSTEDSALSTIVPPPVPPAPPVRLPPSALSFLGHAHTRRTDPAPHATLTARLRSPHARRSWRLHVAPPRHGLSLPHCSMPPVAGTARHSDGWTPSGARARGRLLPRRRRRRPRGAAAPTVAALSCAALRRRRLRGRAVWRVAQRAGNAMHRCVRRSSRTMSGRSSRTSCARACATTSQSRYG